MKHQKWNFLKEQTLLLEKCCTNVSYKFNLLYKSHKYVYRYLFFRTINYVFGCLKINAFVNYLYS